MDKLTNRQLVKMKADANVAIKLFHSKECIKQVRTLLKNLELVKTIDEVQEKRHKQAIKVFYDIPKDVRPKKLNAFKSKWFDAIYSKENLNATLRQIEAL